MSNWIPCGHVGCIMHQGHPGPHYISSWGGASTPYAAPDPMRMEADSLRAEIARLQAQVADLTREMDRQAAVIAGTAYPTDATLTKEQAFHGWHVANRQREGWMARALAAEAEVERRGKEAEARGEAFLAALAQVSTAREALRAILAVSKRHDTPGWNTVSDCARSVLASLKETGA